MKTISSSMCLAAALVGFMIARAVGEEPMSMSITRGNVDPNGNMLWQFESGKKYVLANDIIGRFRVENVQNVEISLNGFKIQGDWSEATQTCSAIKEGQCVSYPECTPMPGTCNGTRNPCNTYRTWEYCVYNGCSWDGKACSGTPSTCHGIDDKPTCETFGCSWSDKPYCYGSFHSLGFNIYNCQNLKVSNGRILGFALGVHIDHSASVTISQVTSIGSLQGAVVSATPMGTIDFNDCIIGVTKGSTVADLSVFQGSIFLEKCIFVGGKVASNSKAVAFIDSEFEPTPTAIFTEVRDGVEIHRELAGLPADFDPSAFVSYLSDRSAMMFGASWCGYCAKQKDLFGDAVSNTIYFDCTMVEGDEKGNQEKKAVMDELGIKSFPTWIIDGKSYPGLKTIPELVSLSGYEAKP